jgi:O-antigen ligase
MKSLVTRLVEWARLLLLVWSGDEEPRARHVRIGLIDFFILILAVVFPWSTSGTSILIGPILIMMLITHGPREMVAQLRCPACFLPVALIGLALVRTTWADGVPWPDRLQAVEKVLKLVWFVPFFLHFQKTSRATSIFAAYVVSNCLLLAFSYLVFCSPAISSIIGARYPGVPLKNYIDQSHAFALIAVIFLGLAVESLRDQRGDKAVAFLAVSVAFLANLAFVNVARTAFVYLPAMFATLVLRFARGWLLLAVFAGSCALVAGLWAVSPGFQSRVMRSLHEVDAFRANATRVDGYNAGGAERLEFWRKSIDFVRSAPIIGHGTGSTKGLFAAEAAGQTGLMAKVTSNPHNQTLAVALQWGIVGCAFLYAMWGAHLLLFRNGLVDQRNDLLSWIGLLAVVQNLASSLLNSHLFDFYQGWLYVLVVAIVGGQLQRQKIAMMREGPK